MIEAIPAYLGRNTINFVKQLGGAFILLLDSARALFTPPFRLRLIFSQFEFVGVKSFFVVLLTGVFTGMVLALESYYGFRKFGGESLMGVTVALSMFRELGPVLTAIMVAARAGSAMAAEIGTMKVTEQIDALCAMGIDPIQYLAVPRILAGIFMVPALTIVCNFVGNIGGYFVGVNILHINPGIYMAKVKDYVELSDIYNGLIKATVFGLILATVSCYKGFATEGGAQGVGESTTSAVVISSISILCADYILTSLLF